MTGTIDTQTSTHQPPRLDTTIMSTQHDDKELEDPDSNEKAPQDVQVPHVQTMPFKYRAGALAFIIFITSGIEFAQATLGPLKNTLVTELKVNSESSLSSPIMRSLPSDITKMHSMERSQPLPT